nr:competence type IV pilus major pilin ComGC [Bacillus sinesaloumensis]
MKNQNGFTLVEMLIVLLVVSILLLVTIPNVTKHNSVIKNKGCDALVKMVEAQVQAYELEKGSPPTTENIATNEYFKEGKIPACPNGDTITITNGVVSVVDPSS